MRDVIYVEEYEDWVHRTVREFDFRIEFNGIELTISDLASVKVSTDLLSGDTFTIGSSVAETIEFDVFMDSDTEISKYTPIKPYISLYTEVLIDRVITPVWQEICLGVFYINPDGITKKGLKSVTVRASSMLSNPDYGGRIYSAPNPEGAFDFSISEVMEDICDKLNIMLDTDLPNIRLTNREHINGMTYKELVNYVAILYGGYAKINNKGNLEFFKMFDTGYVYNTDMYLTMSKQDEMLDIQSFVCAIGEETEGEDNKTKSIKSGNGTIAQTVELICPDMTQSILDGILDIYKDYGYSAISAKIFGNPRLEVGDRIKIIDVKDNIHEFPLQTISYNITGSGINMDVKSIYKVNSIAKGTSIRKSINELQQDIISSKLIVTDQIEAINGTIERLEVTDELHAQKLSLHDADIENLYSEKASIDELNATKALIGVLETDRTIAEEIIATKATVDNLIAGEVTIEKLDVVELEVKDLTVSNTANIDAIRDLQKDKADKKDLYELEDQVEELAGLLDDTTGGNNENSGKITKLEKDLTDFKETVSTTYATKEELNKTNININRIVTIDESNNMNLTEEVYTLIENHISIQDLLDRISALETEVEKLKTPEVPEDPGTEE